MNQTLEGKNIQLFLVGILDFKEISHLVNSNFGAPVPQLTNSILYKEHS